jgi:MinD superfamily P-loop ATPase
VKQIVILSGKGGTGKTSVAAAFAQLALTNAQQHRIVLVDADVDASNLELILSPTILETHEFKGGQVAVIDQQNCEGCGVCAELCRYDAIHEHNGQYAVDPIACEGCALCVYQCPSGAIRAEEQVAGQWFRSDSRYGPLLHAALWPAQENSGKLVTLVKQQARLVAMDGMYDLVLVDGPPGIGCPVISAAAGADLAVIVVEPTVAGIHDMERVLATVNHFGIPALVCINKADLYTEAVAEIEAFCDAQGVIVVGRLPFDTVVTEAMLRGQPVTEYCPDSMISRALSDAWSQVLSAIDGGGECRA